MDLNGMEFQNKILIASGCSFTGGGNFDNEKDFIREFPEHIDLIKTGIFGSDVLDNSTEFKKLYKNYLWPVQLGKLLGTKSVINVAAPGKGTKTSIVNLYNSIFNELKKGESADNLLIIYQIPHFSRDEVYVTEEDAFKCITTEVNDWESYKETYLTSHYSLTILYREQITEIYKLQKFCESLGIFFICFSWEYHDLKFNGMYDDFIKDLKYQKENDMSTGQKYLYKYLSVDDILHYDVDDMIYDINFISFENKTMNENGELNFEKMGMDRYGRTLCKNFNFQMKYPNESNDSHPTIDGSIEIAKILYNKMMSDEIKKLINKYI